MRATGSNRATSILTAAALFGAVAVVYAQVVLTNADLAFGKIAASATAGTVTISPSGMRTSTGGVMLVSSTYGAAAFRVAGTPAASFAIVLPSSAQLASGATHINIDDFRSLPSGTGMLDGSGNCDLLVGATLHIGSYQAKGSYAGSFEVTVTYE